LYYRLNVVELRLPALRDRGNDVIEIAQALLKRASERMQQNDMHFSDDALAAIQTYQWPGNVRELENAIERAVILTDDNIVTATELGIDNSPDRYLSAAMRANLVEPEPQAFGLDDQAGDNSSNQSDLSLDDYFVHFVLENEQAMT